MSERKFITFENAAKYLGVSRSHLYKLNHQKVLPYFKPGGKIIYYDQADLEKFITSNRVSSNDELELLAQKH